MNMLAERTVHILDQISLLVPLLKLRRLKMNQSWSSSSFPVVTEALKY